MTTIAGAVLALAIGCTDAWVFHSFAFDQILIGAGLGALLGFNPLIATKA